MCCLVTWNVTVIVKLRILMRTMICEGMVRRMVINLVAYDSHGAAECYSPSMAGSARGNQGAAGLFILFYPGSLINLLPLRCGEP